MSVTFRNCEKQYPHVRLIFPPQYKNTRAQYLQFKKHVTKTSASKSLELQVGGSLKKKKRGGA